MNEIKERNIAVCIILSIITCGIYGLYWYYCVIRDTNILTGNEEGTSPGMVILLSIITCSIYLIYWMYQVGKRFDDMDAAQGNVGGNRSILYLILAIFGLSIVDFALLQNEINTRTTGKTNY